MNNILVIGGNHHNTLGMVRSLGSKGLLSEVCLIADPSSKIVVKSKYILQTMIFSTEELLIAYLKEKREKNSSFKTVVLIGSDHVAAVVDDNYEDLKDNYVVFNAKGNLSQLMNKETMCQMAVEIGFNVPRHVVVNLDKAHQDTILNCKSIDYPCITKAISSIEGSKTDTTICKNENDLKLFLSKPDLCRTIQIEQFIEKEFEYQFIGLSLDDGKYVLIPGHSQINRPKGIQNTFFFPYVVNDDSFSNTLKKAKDFILRTGYEGIFSMEFIRGKDGKDYFLEINYRNDGNAICVTDAGFNLPYIWYLFATGGNFRKEINSCNFKPVYYCPEIVYTMEYAYGEVTLIQYLKDLFRASSFTNYYKGDSPWYYWPKFILFICYWSYQKVLFKFGIKQAPKESIG